MVDASSAWLEWPQVGISMNPIKGWQRDYYAFCDICVIRQEPNGDRETVIDARVRCLPMRGDSVRCLGEFTSAEMERFHLDGFGYAQAARDLPDILQALAFGCKGAVPVAVNPQLCGKLLHRAIRINEGMGYQLDKSGVFLLREKSRWLDLGMWRQNAESAGKKSVMAKFPGLDVSCRDRVIHAMNRVHPLLWEMGIFPYSTLKQVLDAQDHLVPF